MTEWLTSHPYVAIGLSLVGVVIGIITAINPSREQSFSRVSGIVLALVGIVLMVISIIRLISPPLH